MTVTLDTATMTLFQGSFAVEEPTTSPSLLTVKFGDYTLVSLNITHVQNQLTFVQLNNTNILRLLLASFSCLADETFQITAFAKTTTVACNNTALNVSYFASGESLTGTTLTIVSANYCTYKQAVVFESFGAQVNVTLTAYSATGVIISLLQADGTAFNSSIYADMKLYLDGKVMAIDTTGQIAYNDSQTNKLSLSSQFTMTSANRNI